MDRELELALDREVEAQMERSQELEMFQLLYNYDEEMDNCEEPCCEECELHEALYLGR